MEYKVENGEELNDTKLVVISDIDGTFIDHECYSFEASIEAAKKLVVEGQLAFATSKTAAEVLKLDEDLKTAGVNIPIPYIVENGCGIYLPITLVKDINIEQVAGEIDKNITVIQNDNWLVLTFGEANHEEMLTILDQIEKQVGKKVICFSKMTPEELASHSGLQVEAAKLAKIREFDEPYYIEDGTDEDYNQAEEITKQAGYFYSRGGRYAHISISQDKGKAAKVLLTILEKIYGHLETVAIGDAENDLPLMSAADRGYLVKGKKEITKETPDNVQKIEGVGPTGFSEVIEKELARNN